MEIFHKLFASWFGLGYSPKAPGTMGSLGTLPFIALIAYKLPNLPVWHCGPCEVNLLLPLSVIIFFIALPSAQWMVQHYRVEDPQMVVIDEVAGQTLTFAFIAPAQLLQTWWLIPVGFVLFRTFDIIKPFGIKKLEHLPGAWGVMADDMLGGLYASLVLLALQRII